MKAPQRLPDWEQKLSALIQERAREPFKWGVHDCALWGADAVAAQTGADFGAPFRGTYDDAEGAAGALRQHGAGTLLRTFDRHLRRVPVANAKRGDIIKANKAAGGGIGVVIGSEALLVGDLGLDRLHRSHWAVAWKV